ncbi:MAG: hypothetical protein F8N39_03045 [Clostridiaceae bacterium]|nr:hypothetical protein [Clostridiaceae bacterium]
MLNKINVETTPTGFNIAPSKEYLAKKDREQRIKEAKQISNDDITNEQIYALMLDFMERQSEIYDMVKEIVKSK